MSLQHADHPLLPFGVSHEFTKSALNPLVNFINKYIEQYWSRDPSLRESPNKRLPAGHDTTDHNPFSPSVQPVFHPVMPPVSHQFSCEDSVANSREC